MFQVLGLKVRGFGVGGFFENLARGGGGWGYYEGVRGLGVRG